MAYLPGVPDMGPAPTAPTIAKPSTTTLGKPHGIAAVAHSVGKPGRTQHLGTVVGRHSSGLSQITGGDASLHALGHYGKNPPAVLGGLSGTPGVDPTSHGGARMVRGGSGEMRSHIREGALGPGRMGAPGPATNFNPDVE